MSIVFQIINWATIQKPGLDEFDLEISDRIIPLNIVERTSGKKGLNLIVRK